MKELNVNYRQQLVIQLHVAMDIVGLLNNLN